MAKLLVLLVLLPSLVFAVETMDTAMQLSEGKIRAVVYYNDSSFKPILQVKGEDKITVVVGSKEFEYFDYTEQTINCDSKSTRAVLKVTFNPFGGLNWWAKIGSSNYTLEIPSSSIRNRLDSTVPGFVIGIGVRYQLFPDTFVTPGVCLDFGLTCSDYKFNRFYPGSEAGMVIVNNRLEVTEAQMTLLVSKSKFRNTQIEPYGGLSVFRYYTKLTDESTLVHADGFTDNPGLFVGAKIKIYPLEWLIFEWNFFGKTSLSLGFGWGF
jgi:hypothetical protein